MWRLGCLDEWCLEAMWRWRWSDSELVRTFHLAFATGPGNCFGVVWCVLVLVFLWLSLVRCCFVVCRCSLFGFLFVFCFCVCFWFLASIARSPRFFSLDQGTILWFLPQVHSSQFKSVSSYMDCQYPSRSAAAREVKKTAFPSLIMNPIWCFKMYHWTDSTSECHGRHYLWVSRSSRRAQHGLKKMVVKLKTTCTLLGTSSVRVTRPIKRKYPDMQQHLGLYQQLQVMSW